MSRSMRKVDELLRTMISEEVADLHDPRIGFVTITAVHTTPDLERATVYFTALGDPDRASEGLRAAAPHVRSRVAARVSLRHMPSLDFVLDERTEAARRVSEILSGLERHQDDA